MLLTVDNIAKMSLPSEELNASQTIIFWFENFLETILSVLAFKSVGGGTLVNMRVKLQVKIDIVEWEHEMLTRGDIDELA